MGALLPSHQGLRQVRVLALVQRGVSGEGLSTLGPFWGQVMKAGPESSTGPDLEPGRFGASRHPWCQAQRGAHGKAREPGPQPGGGAATLGTHGGGSTPPQAFAPASSSWGAPPLPPALSGGRVGRPALRGRGFWGPMSRATSLAGEVCGGLGTGTASSMTPLAFSLYNVITRHGASGKPCGSERAVMRETRPWSYCANSF